MPNPIQKWILGILAATGIIFSVPLFGQDPESADILEFKGGSVTYLETEPILKYRMYTLRQNEYEMRYEVAVRLLKKKLFAAEASALGVSVEKMLDNYIREHYKKPSEEVMKDYYKMYSSELGMPYEKAVPVIRRELDLIQKKELMHEYFKTLVEKYDVHLNMESPVEPRMDIDPEDDPYWGNNDARVVVVEFSDFECQYCRKNQTIVRQIEAEYKNKIKWVFKDFPLSVHRQSLKAHIAAACAGEQGKYFPYHRKLYDAAPDLSDAVFMKIAKDKKLNIPQFQKCLEDPDNKKLQEISNDIEYGRLIGLRGTPTLFVNGKIIPGMISHEDLKKIIDEELEHTEKK